MPPKGFARNETGYIKWMTKNEFELLVSALPKKQQNWKLILYILLYMGLRRGEVARLKWIDIIGDFERLRFRDIKNKEIRERIIPDIVAHEFRIYEFSQRRFQNPGIYIFEPLKSSGSQRQHINPNTITVMINRLRKEAGLTDWYYIKKTGDCLSRITPHTFRHFFITEIYKKSDLITAQRIIGHKKSETTARYVFLNSKSEIEKRLVNLL